MKKQFVISLGGSLVVPDGIDAAFLKKFGALIKKFIAKGDSFILIVGGGKTCRQYQQGLSKAKKPTTYELDQLGIASTWLNAELVRLFFGKDAHPEIIRDPNTKIHLTKKLLVAGGWKPGRSTDDIAVLFAQKYGSQTVINLSNIDYLYDKDPRKFLDAKKIETITWKELKKIIGSTRVPGGNYPFDPVAITRAKALKLTAVIANGKNLHNLEQILLGKKAQGTIIH